MSFGEVSGFSGARVALTGATGFIGSRVLDALTGAGAQTTAIVRSRRSADLVSAAGATPALVTLRDDASLREALAGTEALVHLAYDVRAGAEDNLAAFNALMTAAEAAGVARIIHMSSIVVYDDWPNGDLDESGSMERIGGGPYRSAKIEMERRLMSGASSAAILQPTLVYGPGSALWTDQLATSLAQGGLVLPEPDGLCNAVFVDDVAQAVLRAIALMDLKHERFLISSEAPVSWHDLLSGYAGIVGGQLLRVPVEEVRARLGSEPGEQTAVPLAAHISRVGRQVLGHDRFEGLVGLAKSLRGRAESGPAYPDHNLFQLMTAKGTCRIDHAGTRLGYAPEYDLAAGLKATAPHLQTLAGANS